MVRGPNPDHARRRALRWHGAIGIGNGRRPRSPSTASGGIRAKNFLTTTGPQKFLHDAFSLESVRSLEVIRGRDVVALERVKVTA